MNRSHEHFTLFSQVETCDTVNMKENKDILESAYSRKGVLKAQRGSLYCLRFTTNKAASLVIYAASLLELFLHFLSPIAADWIRCKQKLLIRNRRDSFDFDEKVLDYSSGGLLPWGIHELNFEKTDG